MAIDNIPAPGCVLENIEMRDDNELPGDEVVDRATGEFLVLDRFSSHSRREGKELILVYGVQRRLTPEEFYGLIHMRSTGPCTADDISDHLVKAFDYGAAGELGLDSALFAYRAPDGRIMFQHST
jgi:hypothetical protein